MIPIGASRSVAVRGKWLVVTRAALYSTTVLIYVTYRPS